MTDFLLALYKTTGYSGGALKHGPFALIESDENGKLGATPIIMLIFDDEHAHHMRTAAEEVKARGADVIIITDKKSLAEGLDEDPLVIPSNGPLTALGAVLPIQLLAFELAMLRLVSFIRTSMDCIWFHHNFNLKSLFFFFFFLAFVCVLVKTSLTYSR